MTSFEILKDLVKRGVRYSEPYAEDPTLRQVVRLSVGRGDKSKHIQFPLDEWETPRAEFAIRELHHAVTRGPLIK